jgi:hypothetical protein
MARWSIGSYNRFIGASVRKYGHSVAVAREQYRQMRGKLNRPVFRTDLKAHPKISAGAAKRAFARTPLLKPERPPKVPTRAAPPEEVEIVPEEVEEELGEFDEGESSSDEGGIYEPRS